MMKPTYFMKANGGSTAVEFALTATPLVILLFAAMQIFLLFFAQQDLETAAETAGRLILTGSVQKSGMTQAAFKTAVCKQVAALLDCNKLMVDVQVASSFSGADMSTPTITYGANNTIANSWNFNVGSPGSIVVMRLLYLWPVFNLPGLTLVNQPSSSRLMMATAVFKNEAFN